MFMEQSYYIRNSKTGLDELQKILLEIIDIEQNFKEKKISKKKFYA